MFENENASEIVETIATNKNSGSGLIAGTLIGGAIVGGAGLLYKFAVKPIVKKIKARKTEKKESEETEGKIVDSNDERVKKARKLN